MSLICSIIDHGSLCRRALLIVLVWGLGGAGSVPAQVISLKTAPIATGSQFQLYPSHARGMGGISLAVDDSLGDPFVNPAETARLEDTWAFSAPAYYTITGQDGRARTLSVGILSDRGQWFGGLALALQQLEPGSRPSRPTFQPVDPRFSTQPPITTVPIRPLRETSAENRYVTLLGGLRLTDRFALGGTIRWAGLEAKEGVDLLYPRNDGLRQEGHRLDVRAGLLGEWDGQSLSVLLLHHRIDMQHDVRYIDRIWREDAQQTFLEVRRERYFDRTNTWGLHLEYARPLGSEGWHLGTKLTGNRKGHPKIPNYDLMNIPRDPGTSWASSVGVGVSHSDGHTTVGADLIYAPIVSETWAEAQERIEQPDGGVILPGERTVVNDFNFANTTLRIGLRQEQNGWELQGGLEVRTTRYWLTQDDRVEQTKRDQYEEWSEWQLTWGGAVEWGVLTLRYTGHLTLGTGRPGVTSPGFRTTAGFAAASDFIVAPRGPLTVRESQVFTHQLSLIIPVGGDEE